MSPQHWCVTPMEVPIPTDMSPTSDLLPPWICHPPSMDVSPLPSLRCTAMVAAKYLGLWGQISCWLNLTSIFHWSCQKGPCRVTRFLPCVSLPHTTHWWTVHSEHLLRNWKNKKMCRKLNTREAALTMNWTSHHCGSSAERQNKKDCCMVRFHGSVVKGVSVSLATLVLVFVMSIVRS